VAELLRAAILERFGSVRAYARYRAGGEKASLDDVERERRAINKHLHDGAQPEVAQAQAYARDLGKPLDFFVRPISRESKKIRQLEAEVARLQAELAEARRSGQR
jgi:hypothetical protein